MWLEGAQGHLQAVSSPLAQTEGWTCQVLTLLSTDKWEQLLGWGCGQGRRGKAQGVGSQSSHFSMLPAAPRLAGRNPGSQFHILSCQFFIRRVTHGNEESWGLHVSMSHLLSPLSLGPRGQKCWQSLGTSTWPGLNYWQGLQRGALERAIVSVLDSSHDYNEIPEMLTLHIKRCIEKVT